MRRDTRKIHLLFITIYTIADIKPVAKCSKVVIAPRENSFPNSPRPAGTRTDVHHADVKPPFGSAFSPQSKTWSRGSPAASTGSKRCSEWRLKGGSPFIMSCRKPPVRPELLVSSFLNGPRVHIEAAQEKKKKKKKSPGPGSGLQVFLVAY